MGFHGNKKCQPRQETTTKMFKLQLNFLSHFQKLNINTICLSFPSVWCSSRALLNPVFETLEKN